MAKSPRRTNRFKQSTNVLVDLLDTFLNNYHHDVQNHSDTDPKSREDSDKKCRIYGPDVSLPKLKLISDQKNDLKLAPLFKLVLPPVELDKISVGYYVKMVESGGHQMSLQLMNG